MDKDILYIFTTCLLRAFVPLFWGIFLLFYRKKFWQNIGICGVFLPIGILYFFDSFSRLPTVAPVDIYDVRQYLVFIWLTPFARFYANYALNIKIKKSAHLLHFIPCAVMLALYLLLQQFRPHIPFCYNLNELLGYFSEYPLYVVYYLMLPTVYTTQCLGYAIPVMVRLWRLRCLHQKHGHSVKHINQYFAVVLSFAAYPFVCMFFFSYYNNTAVMVAHNLSLPVFVTIISILCMNQQLPLKTTFAPHDFICKNVVTDNDENVLSSINLKERLHTYFATQKPYRNANLTLQEVADHLNINRTYLSAFINKEYNCDFRKFLTGYRMEAAKEKLLNKNFEISNIANAVGYSSRTTFYKAFKENVCSELSPTEWREKHLKDD